MDYSMLLIFGIVFFGAIVQGLTGFGFSLVAVPLMLLILPPEVVVAVVLLQVCLINIVVSIESRQGLRVDYIWPLLATALFAMPLGTYLLIMLSPGTIRIVAGIVVLVFALMLMFNIRRPFKNEPLSFLPIGFLSGLLNGSITMSGPPVVLGYANQGIDKLAFRSNLATYFLVLNLMTLPVFYYNGLFNEGIIFTSAKALVATTVGLFIGIKLARLVPEKIFRTLVLWLVLLSGVATLASGLGA